MSPALHLVMDAEADWFRGLEGTPADQIIHVGEEAYIEVGGLPGGMASGKPSVAFCIPLPDGRVVIAETSLALLLTAGDALKARYGDPRT